MWTLRCMQRTASTPGRAFTCGGQNRWIRRVKLKQAHVKKPPACGELHERRRYGTSSCHEHTGQNNAPPNLKRTVCSWRHFFFPFFGTFTLLTIGFLRRRPVVNIRNPPTVDLLKNDQTTCSSSAKASIRSNAGATSWLMFVQKGKVSQKEYSVAGPDIYKTVSRRYHVPDDMIDPHPPPHVHRHELEVGDIHYRYM